MSAGIVAERVSTDIPTKYIVENVAIVQYLPQYASARIAPIRGVK
jgi:hypothetical protein